MRGSVELIYSSAEGGYTNASTSIKRQGRRGRRRPEVILERTRMEEREKRKESGSKIDKGKGGL